MINIISEENDGQASLYSLITPKIFCVSCKSEKFLDGSSLIKFNLIKA